ncbi:BTAD domain-containing putative transcriptional regulator [Streptomyces sp. NPDC002004]
MMSIRVLGALEAERDGEPVPLGGRRQRSVLALLAVAHGRVVPVDRMIEDIWQGAPPAQAVTSLQAYVSNLRRLLEPGRPPRTPARLLVSAPPGYALRLADEAVDGWRFERLLGEARDGAERRPDVARRLLGEALSLWQGPAYAEFADEPWARAEVARLDELRLVAREVNVTAALRSADVAGAVVEAELLTRDAPLREEGWRLHALALWAADRQADALAALRRARAVLAEEIGLDPGPALNELEAAVLGGHTELLRRATQAPRGAPATPAEPSARPSHNAPGASQRPRTAPHASHTAPGTVAQQPPAAVGMPGRRPGTASPGVPAQQPHTAAESPARAPRATAQDASASSRTAPQAFTHAPAGGPTQAPHTPAEGPAQPPRTAADLPPHPSPGGSDPVDPGPAPAGRDPQPPGRPAAEPELFVGRGPDLARLVECAARAAAAGPGVALVTGEAGLGKSTLLDRFGERLRADGWLVVVGRTTDAEGAPPAWPWVQALRSVAASAPPPPDCAQDLAPLLCDDASGTARVTHEDAAAGRFRLHRAVWRWLAAVAHERPLAVLLDDLHWADAETLALLAALPEPPSGTALLVTAAYRPDEIDGRLTDTLAVLARRAPLRVALEGLSGTAVADVVRAAGAGPVDAETVAALTERTGGNPFYVRESARLLSAEGALVALSEVPDGVRDVLRRRLGRLPESSVAVLRLTAVAGREAEVEVLVDAADTGEEAVLDALDAGLVAGLLTEPSPGRVRFTHALVRDTLLADLSGMRVARMHGRIAAALERLGSADVSALAHHFARASSSPTAAKAVQYCLRAAALAEGRHAHDAAADLLTTALDCLERIPEAATDDRDAERIDLLGRLLRAQVRTGAVMAARATRQRAIEAAAGSGRDELLVGALTAWSEPTPWQTRPYGVVDEPVVALLERTLDLPGLAPADRCGLLLAYCAELSDMQNPRVRAAADEALALAGTLGDPHLRARSLAALVRELDVEREGGEQAVRSDELVALATEHDLPVFRWYGLFTLASSAAAEGDPDGAYERLDACMELARAYRMPGPLAVGLTASATRATIEGRGEDAERLYAEAAAGMARQGSPHAEGFLLLATAIVRAGQGRLAEVVPQARRMVDDYGSAAADLLAAALCAAGEEDEAREILARVGPLRTDFFFKVFATFRAMAAVALGEKDRARELYEALLPHRDAQPPSSGFTVAIRPVAYTLGELAGLLGLDGEAAAHRARAAAIAERWHTAAEGGVPG